MSGFISVPDKRYSECY